jgi:hypothetical protein
MSREVPAVIKADRSRSSLPARTGPLERERLDRTAEGKTRGVNLATLTHSFGRVRVHETLAPVIQPKLRMGTPGDEYEREADSVADELTSAATGRTETPLLSRVRASTLSENSVFGIAAHITPGVQSKIESLQREGGEPLPAHVREAIEPRLGHDLGGVRIHRNSAAHGVAEDMQARALTVGDHIVFNSGQYPAGNETNSRLLTHELAHTVQQHGAHPIVQRAPMVIDAGTPEGGLQPAPAEDLIEPGSDLDRQFNSLSLSIRQLLHNVFGEAGAPAEEVWAELFPKGQFSEARTAAESYRAVTNELSTRKLDIAFGAQWLDIAISTMSTVRAALSEIAGSGTTQASMAKTLSRQARSILGAAKRLRKNQKIARGSALAAGARASTVKRLRREHGEVEEQKRREQRPGLLQMAHASRLDLLKMKFDAEQSDPEFAETLNKEIEVTEAIERRIPDETPLAALDDRLGTIERSSREDAARLIARMDKVDLTRLAGHDSERVGDLGLRLAESTPSQTIIGLAGTPLPFIGPELADIVSERFEEKQAIARLSTAMVSAGGPSEQIAVPDLDQLTHLEIKRSGERVTFRKSELLHSLELLDASRTGSSSTSQREWTFSASDLVTLTVVGSGQTVTRPAFAWLHAEDVGLQATYQEWASLAQEGAAVARASIKAATSKVSTPKSGVTPAGALSKENIRPVKPPSAAPRPVTGVKGKRATTERSTSPAGTGHSIDSSDLETTNGNKGDGVLAPEQNAGWGQGRGSDVIQTPDEIRQTSTRLGAAREPERAASRGISQVPQKNLAIAEGGRITAEGENLVWQHKYISYAKEGVEQRVRELIKTFERSVQNAARWKRVRKNWNETHKGAVDFDLPETPGDPSIAIELDIGMAGRRPASWLEVEERLRAYFVAQKGIPPNARLSFWWDETLLTADEMLR